MFLRALTEQDGRAYSTALDEKVHECVFGFNSSPAKTAAGDEDDRSRRDMTLKRSSPSEPLTASR